MATRPELSFAFTDRADQEATERMIDAQLIAQWAEGEPARKAELTRLLAAVKTERICSANKTAHHGPSALDVAALSAALIGDEARVVELLEAGATNQGDIAKAANSRGHYHITSYLAKSVYPEIPIDNPLPPIGRAVPYLYYLSPATSSPPRTMPAALSMPAARTTPAAYFAPQA